DRGILEAGVRRESGEAREVHLRLRGGGYEVTRMGTKYGVPALAGEPHLSHPTLEPAKVVCSLKPRMDTNRHELDGMSNCFSVPPVPHHSMNASGVSAKRFEVRYHWCSLVSIRG